MSDPKFEKPIPDPTKIDRDTYREVINEWREIAFKKIDHNVLLVSENKRHESKIKQLKESNKKLSTEVLDLEDEIKMYETKISQLKTNDAKN